MPDSDGEVEKSTAAVCTLGRGRWVAVAVAARQQQNLVNWSTTFTTQTKMTTKKKLDKTNQFKSFSFLISFAKLRIRNSQIKICMEPMPCSIQVYIYLIGSSIAVAWTVRGIGTTRRLLRRSSRTITPSTRLQTVPPPVNTWCRNRAASMSHQTPWSTTTRSAGRRQPPDRVIRWDATMRPSSKWWTSGFLSASLWA